MIERRVSPVYLTNWLPLRSQSICQCFLGLTLGIGEILAADAMSIEPPSGTNYNPAYTFTIFAGLPGARGFKDGFANQARFSLPTGIAVDRDGNVYVGDTNNFSIRKISRLQVVSTLPLTLGGQKLQISAGAPDEFGVPMKLAVDRDGTLYVFHQDEILKVSLTGVATAFAGSARRQSDQIKGLVDGVGVLARFDGPTALTIDQSGNLYVADSGSIIRRVSKQGEVKTLAGKAGFRGSEDGLGANARFNVPSGLAVDSSGSIYVADTLNCTIRKITPAGAVSTLAGSAGVRGDSDGVGSAARFYGPTAVAVDGSGDIFVADSANHTIRRITPSGLVTTVAGKAREMGSTEGRGDEVRFEEGKGLALDKNGKLYVTDFRADVIMVGVGD